MWERLTHWPSTGEGLAWGATALAIIHAICPTMDFSDPNQLFALIPVIRGAMAKGKTSPSGTPTVIAPSAPTAS